MTNRNLILEQAIQDLINDPYASWSRAGAETVIELSDYLSNCFNADGIDLAAIRGDYAELTPAELNEMIDDDPSFDHSSLIPIDSDGKTKYIYIS